MAAILVSLGFTFLIDRMTEVLTPDIYIELTAFFSDRASNNENFPNFHVNIKFSMSISIFSINYDYFIKPILFEIFKNTHRIL
jgi:hypothetical protein